MKMKVSDYIVEFFITKGIMDVFGYPGGMVTHLMDSFRKFEEKGFTAHLMYHEQAASFAACAYAQCKNLPGVAYATSGPGATNLVTGIANAYFDSIPTIFITGQVNLSENSDGLLVRQKRFQEMKIVDVVKPITKFSTRIDNAEDIPRMLEECYLIATTERPGPVLIDIPMNISSSEIEICDKISNCNKIEISENNGLEEDFAYLLNHSKNPVVIAGAGISQTGSKKDFNRLIEKWKIPVITSMIAIDTIGTDNPLNFGFLGVYGHRYANIILSECDLIISIGSRLDLRQIGSSKDKFAKNAKLVRVEIDKNECGNVIKEDEIDIIDDLRNVIFKFLKIEFRVDEKWLERCNYIKNKLKHYDDIEPVKFLKKLTEKTDFIETYTTDVGQNQVWAAQSVHINNKSRVLFSGGHAAMGYSIPATIGAYIATGKNVVAISGDGGFQMNIQELQFISQYRLPIKILVINNKSLGMIRHFQELYFDKKYFQTVNEGGYGVVDLKAISKAYGIRYKKMSQKSISEKVVDMFKDEEPTLFEIVLNEDTYVYPKLRFGDEITNQEPYLSKDFKKELDIE